MTTRNILLEYTIPDICDIILDYASEPKSKKEYFRLGDYERCVEIIDEIRNLDITKKNLVLLYNSLLIEACKGGHAKIFNLLMENGANDWKKGLSTACIWEHIELIEFIIEKTYGDWSDVFLSICNHGHIKIVKLLIQKLEEFNALHCIDWDEILKGVCNGGNIEAVQVIVNNMHIRT